MFFFSLCLWFEASYLVASLSGDFFPFWPGSNPNDVMNLLQEMKGLQCTLDETVYYGFQQYIRSADSQLFGQPTLPSMFQREAGGAAPGGAHGPVQILTREVRGRADIFTP